MKLPSYYFDKGIYLRFREWVFSEVDEKDYYNIYKKVFSTTIKHL